MQPIDVILEGIRRQHLVMCHTCKQSTGRLAERPTGVLRCEKCQDRAEQEQHDAWINETGEGE